MKEIFGGKLRRTGDAQSMKDKCATDLKLFCEYYLADSFKSAWSEKFHLWLIEKIEDVILNHADEETRNVVASPRGHAKSTLCSFGAVLWAICYGYKHFIVIISATGPVAKQFLLDVRNELEYNERIKNDFGEMKNDEMWNSNEIYMKNKVFVTSRGAGAQMRGMKFNSTRPDFIVLDDLETAEQVASPSQNAAFFRAERMVNMANEVQQMTVGVTLEMENFQRQLLKLTLELEKLRRIDLARIIHPPSKKQDFVL